MLKDLSARAVMTTLSIAITGCMILFAFSSWFQYTVVLFAAILAIFAIWEFEQFAKAKGGKMILPVLIGIGFFEVCSFFIIARDPSWAVLPIAVFFFGLLILFALHFREKEGALVNLSTSSFGLLYIAVPMGMALGILYGGGQDGRWWLAYLIFVTKISDIGAYFAGSLWGRHKLAPQISPGKTVEGAFFGLLCAILSSFGFHLLSETMGASRFYLGIYEWLFLGLILGVVGQFSDLAESLLKRDANKKDSSSLLGLGGVLDTIDSLLFNAPIVYLYLNFIKS